MADYLGSWKIDDLLTFYAQINSPLSGDATDSDSAPTYRVYEDENGTPLLTGSMATLDASNTDGFYSEQITLSAANGFEKGKCYCIRGTTTSSGITPAHLWVFQIEAEVDANAVSDKTGYSIASGQIVVKKNVALSNFEFLMRDSSDHITPKTGLTITAERSIDGGAFGSCTNSASEVSAGIYKINLAAGDLNGTTITLKFTATGADSTYITVLPQT